MTAQSFPSSVKIEKVAYITSTQSWTVPADVSQIEIILCGGGGGGTDSGQATAHGGFGGSGSAELAWLTVTPGSSHTVTIGAGGSTVSYNGTPSAGGTSSFGSLLSVTGGYNITGNATNGTANLAIAGRPGGRSGGKGARYFSVSGNADTTAGNLMYLQSEKGLSGFGGGGGMGHPKLANIRATSWFNLNGSDGGGSGAFQYFNGSTWTGSNATAGVANSGAGGGGGGGNDGGGGSGYYSAANGGSGVAIIRYWSSY